MLELALALALAAGSTVPYLKDTYSIICNGEQSTGFNWKDGDWVKANFKPSQYVISKNSDNKCLEPLGNSQNTVFETSKFHSRSVCLNVRGFGEKYSAYLSEVCDEYYSQSKNEDWEITISCRRGIHGDIKLSPDGRFHASSLHSNLGDKPKGDYKDSLSVDVGRCAVVS